MQNNNMLPMIAMRAIRYGRYACGGGVRACRFEKIRKHRMERRKVHEALHMIDDLDELIFEEVRVDDWDVW